jgi:inward rectifier potassium channel
MLSLPPAKGVDVTDSPTLSLSQSLRTGDGPDVGRAQRAQAWHQDIYHRLIMASWPSFFAGFAAAFMGLNLIFAGLYALDPAGLLQIGAHEHDSVLYRSFLFSVHTIATVGYGNIYPDSTYVNDVVVVEIAIGIQVFALGSGLAFARFSIPRARIMFSDVAVVRNFEGCPTLMFRAANQRKNFIVEASVRVSILRDVDDDGRTMRRFFDLALIRSSSPVFSLTWQVMHRIDETSPLYGMSHDDLAAKGDELVVLMTGIDSTVSQPVIAGHGYSAQSVLWDHAFVDVMCTDEKGRRWIDYSKFHEVVPIPRRP